MFFGTLRSRTEARELEAHADEVLRLTGLWELRDRPVSTLPHERQRLVEIARALAHRPALVMLDEPAAGMNPTDAARLTELIYRMRDGGITVLLVEHNMPLVMRIADKITVLNFGRKIAEGTAEEIRNNPEVVKAYLGQRLSRERSRNAAA
jgi:ABC-type branched-subunit amino acid transport system ATPase component